MVTTHQMVDLPTNSGVPHIADSSSPSTITLVIPKSINFISSYPGFSPPKQRIFSG